MQTRNFDSNAAIRHDEQTEARKRRGLQEVPRSGLAGGFGQDSRMQYQELFHLFERWRPLQLFRILRQRLETRLEQDGCAFQNPGVVGAHATDTGTFTYAKRR